MYQKNPICTVETDMCGLAFHLKQNQKEGLQIEEEIVDNPGQCNPNTGHDTHFGAIDWKSELFLIS